MTKRIAVIKNPRREELAALLKNLGYEVETPEDAIEALYMLAQARERNKDFDLIMTDVEMPGAANPEMFLSLISRAAFDTPVVISTNGDVPINYGQHEIVYEDSSDMVRMWEAMVKRLAPLG